MPHALHGRPPYSPWDQDPGTRCWATATCWVVERRAPSCGPNRGPSEMDPALGWAVAAFIQGYQLPILPQPASAEGSPNSVATAQLCPRRAVRWQRSWHPQRPWSPGRMLFAMFPLRRLVGYTVYLFHGIWWEHVKHCSMFPLRRLVAQNIGSRDIGPALKMKHPMHWGEFRNGRSTDFCSCARKQNSTRSIFPFLCLLQDQQTKTPRLRDRHQRVEADAILHCCRPLWIAARRACEWLLWIHNWVTTTCSTCCSVALTSNQQANPLG